MTINVQGAKPVFLVDELGNSYAASPGGSSSGFYLTTTATTNATSVKTSAGALLEISCSNNSAAAVFLKVYNKASSPVVGTDVPVQVIPVAANSNVTLGYGANGKRFTTGIAYAVTGAITTADTTAVAAGVLVSGTYL